MTQFKRIFAVILMLCMVFGLCACGGNGEDNTTEAVPDTTEAETTTEAEEQSTVDDGKVAYQVKVVDEAGNPIAGALVQMCKDTCFPSSTNESGIAEFSLPEADYKVSFLFLPAGYTYSSEAQEFYFDGDTTELTITLKKAE